MQVSSTSDRTISSSPSVLPSQSGIYSNHFYNNGLEFPVHMAMNNDVHSFSRGFPIHSTQFMMPSRTFIGIDSNLGNSVNSYGLSRHYATNNIGNGEEVEFF